MNQFRETFSPKSPSRLSPALETARPFEAKFHVEPPWDGGRKICSNGPGHMTNIAAMPINGKNLKKSSSLELNG